MIISFFLAPLAEESAIPTVIYKCNNCEHYTQTKEEMLLHVEAHHANSEQDFISIPTNEAALQAFQAAVVMATAAAAAAAAAVSSETPATTTTAATTTTSTGVHIKKEPQEEDCVEDRELGAAYMNCPLCNDSFLDKSQLEQHLMQVHSVNSDGLERLLLLVEQQMWKNVDRKCMAEEEKCEKVLNLTKTSQPATPTSINSTLNCSQCSASFKHEQQLLQHAQQLEHFVQQSNGEYACLAANLTARPCQQLFSTLAAMYTHYKHEHLGVVISERHVYKYRCKQCSLAFKTPERLATHSLYHMMRDATKCAICQRNFRSTQALQKHVEQAHAQTSTATLPEIPQQVSPNIRLISPDMECSDQVEAKLENEGKSVTPDLKQHMSSKSSQHDSEVSEPKQQLNESRDTLTPTAPTSALSYEMLQRFFLQQQQQPHLPPHIQNLGPALLANPDMAPFNPVDMINMMQFHQLMSLNFMNLAPPLIIGNNNNVIETANPQIPLDCLPNINCNTPSSSGTKTPLRSNETPAQFLHQTPNVTSNSNQVNLSKFI